MLTSSIGFNNGLPQRFVGKLFVFTSPAYVTFVKRPGSSQRPVVACGSSDQGLFLSGAKRYTHAPRDPNSGLEWL